MKAYKFHTRHIIDKRKQDLLLFKGMNQHQWVLTAFEQDLLKCMPSMEAYGCWFMFEPLPRR